LTDTAGRRPEFAERDSVLWVGNIRALKRPELLLEAAGKLPHLEFHIIGGPMPGSESLLQRCARRPQSWQMCASTGPFPTTRWVNFYERAGCSSVRPEIEGFPNTYLQAWSRGTPVVAFLDPEQLIARNGMGRAVTSVSELCEAIANAHRRCARLGSGQSTQP